MDTHLGDWRLEGSPTPSYRYLLSQRLKEGVLGLNHKNSALCRSLESLFIPQSCDIAKRPCLNCIYRNYLKPGLMPYSDMNPLGDCSAVADHSCLETVGRAQDLSQSGSLLYTYPTGSRYPSFSVLGYHTCILSSSGTRQFAQTIGDSFSMLRKGANVPGSQDGSGIAIGPQSPIYDNQRQYVGD